MTMVRDEEDEMSASEIAALFGEKPPKKEAEPKPDPYDIYAVSARINNHATYTLGLNNLSPQGRMVCNTYAHTLKALYDFAKKMRKGKKKEQLLALIKEQEKSPGELVAALQSGVNTQ
jgi:hypothetical protein